MSAWKGSAMQTVPERGKLGKKYNKTLNSVMTIGIMTTDLQLKIISEV